MAEKIKYYSLNFCDKLLTNESISYLLKNIGYSLINEIENDYNYEIKLYKKSCINCLKHLFTLDIYIVYIKADNIKEEFIEHIKKGFINKFIKESNYVIYVFIETNNCNRILSKFIKSAISVPKLNGKRFEGNYQVPIIIDCNSKKAYIGNYYLHYYTGIALNYKKAVEMLFNVLEKYYIENNFEFSDNLKTIKSVDKRNDIFDLIIFIFIILFIISAIILFCI